MEHREAPALLKDIAKPISMSNPIKSIIKKSILVCIGALIGTELQAVTVNVGWNPNQESNITGYTVHYGTASGQYDQSVGAGTATSTDVANLNPNTTYYFTVTAVDSHGFESNASTEIKLTTSSGIISNVDANANGIPDAWETANGLTGANAAASADPDHDGVPNFLEYAFALKANEANLDGLPTEGKYRNPSDGKDYLTITYRKRLDNTKLAYTVMTSSDLKNWAPASVTEVAPATLSSDGQSATVTVRLLAPIGTTATSCSYLRLNVKDTTLP